jgi:tetratricopeptide (TPR) repeat protein
MPKPRKNSGSKPPLKPAALRSLLKHTLGGLGSNKRSDEHRAQELVYDAMEASTSERRLLLVRQALELDPENVDALRMLEETSDLRGEERIEALRGTVAAGAKRLGKKAFNELVPHFWGFHETRPYMRARQALATALHEAGRLDEAVQEWAAMLDLNENDNQGVRYELLPTLLARGRLDEARALMERFKDDCEWSVVFAWSRVLERQLSGDDAAAMKALAVARKQNAHMEAYLKSQRKLPKTLPESYSPGSKEEALSYADVLMGAWKAHLPAVEWLLGQS